MCGAQGQEGELVSHWLPLGYKGSVMWSSTLSVLLMATSHPEAPHGEVSLPHLHLPATQAHLP